MQRNWFFWMESLQITAAERRVILTLMGVLLMVTGIRTFHPGRTIYDEHYYEPVIAEFLRLADVKEEERRVVLARYYPPVETPTGTLPTFGIDLPVTPLRAAFEGELGTSVTTGGFRGDVDPGGDAMHDYTARTILATGDLKAGSALSAASDNRGALSSRQDKSGRSRASGASGTGAELRVNIQQAGLDELVLLPGIGPVTAGRILAYREEHGPFRKPEDLLNVSGIGPRTLENILPFIVLEPGPVPAEASAATNGEVKPAEP